MAKKSKHISFFGRIVLFFNYLAALALLLSYSASYISPDTIWPIAFCGLAYPFILIANIVFILFWLLSLKKYFLISLITIVIGWNFIGKHIQFNSEQEVIKSDSTLSIMSFNVKAFHHFNWFKNVDTPIYNEFRSFLKNQNPDIICFQEYYQRNKTFNITDTLSKHFNLKNYHLGKYENIKNKYFIATFSKFPIVNRGKVIENDSIYKCCIFTDILFNKDTIRIYNIHLQSIQLGSEEYLFTDNYDLLNIEKEETKRIKRGSKNVIKKLKKAFIVRSIQSKKIKEHINNSAYPVIVCGDFNDTPSSFAYHKISHKLKDSFVESGNETGQTYAGKFPSFRIDYILHSDDFKSSNFTTYKENDFSDHFPIYCNLKSK